MTIQELRDNRNKLLQDAQKLLLAAGVTAEHRSSAQRMIADADALEVDIASLVKIATADAEERSRTTPPRPVPGAGNDVAATETAEIRSAKQKKAFEQYVRFGSTDAAHRSYLAASQISGTTSAEFRDLTTANTGQLIPEGFYPVLTEAQKAWGAILNAVTTRHTDNGAPMKIAFANDTANGLTVLGEAVAPSETEPAFAGAIVNTDFLTTGVIKVTLPELQDSAFDIDSFIRKNFGKRYSRGLTALVTNASSTGNVASLVAGAFTGATSAAPTALGYSDITALYAAMDPAYVETASWSMNGTTRGYLLGVTDSLGRPLFVPSPTSGAFDALLGRPVILNQSLSNIAATKVALQFGDFAEGYLLRIAQDLAIIRLNERFMDTLEVGFIGYCRVGGTVTDAGTHPILNLVQHA
jgi:HK97 family phage major capsid protein